MTFDNGTEFAKHYRLHELGMETFFCDVRSPWQKGGVENAIGRLRRSLPRKTNLATLSDEEFERLFLVYNNTPRKCLGFRTPAEVFLSQALHLKWNPSSRLRGNDGRGLEEEALTPTLSQGERGEDGIPLSREQEGDARPFDRLRVSGWEGWSG